MKKKQKFTSDQIKNMSPEELEKLGIGDTLKSLAEKGTKFDYELKFKKAEDIEKKLNTKTFSEGDIVDAVHDANLIADINESIKLDFSNSNSITFLIFKSTYNEQTSVVAAR